MIKRNGFGVLVGAGGNRWNTVGDEVLAVDGIGGIGENRVLLD